MTAQIGEHLRYQGEIVRICIELSAVYLAMGSVSQSSSFIRACCEDWGHDFLVALWFMLWTYSTCQVENRPPQMLMQS